MSEEKRRAAVDAVVWGVVADAAKDGIRGAKGVMADMLPGDSFAAVVGDTVLGRALMAKGRRSIHIHDSAAFLSWAMQRHPEEVESVVRASFVNTLKIAGGMVIDRDGDIVPGAEVRTGNPTITITKTPDAEQFVRDLIERGMSLDGPAVKALESNVIDAEVVE